jgi:hypothetical protein
MPAVIGNALEAQHEDLIPPAHDQLPRCRAGLSQQTEADYSRERCAQHQVK